MNIDIFLQKLIKNPAGITFLESMAFIDSHYLFTPTNFSNGNQLNKAGQNNGSCKIFAFGLLHKLTEQQTMACFGEYYRNDVLNNPAADDHQNIRQFMLKGWTGIKFSGQALVLK